MKRKTISAIALFACLWGGWLGAKPAYGEHSAGSGAEVQIQKRKKGTSDIQDPENPLKIVDPGTSPKMDGDLRIDFVPTLNFSVITLGDETATVPVNAQLFNNDIGPRGNFIQVTDERDDCTGWKLQLKQENQFTHTEKEGVQLKGAVISFDQAWTNSQLDKMYAPIVKKEVIQMSAIGQTYDLATAETGKGINTWSIAFGASAENQYGQAPTLAERKDQQGEPVMDAQFNQPSYTNSAVNLTIPGQSTYEPGTYSTVLTWILAELP